MLLQVVLIEHDDVDGLYPLTSTHCSWEVRFGALTTLERWALAVPSVSVTAHSHRELHLASFFERHPQTPAFLPQPTLIMSGHVVTSPSVMRQLVDTCSATTTPIVIYCSGRAIGAFLPSIANSPAEARILLDALDVDSSRSVEIAGHLVNRLWQTFDHLADAIGWDADLLPYRVHSDATIHPTAVLDEERGPVIVMQGAQVAANAVLAGPVAVGPNARVKPLTSLSKCVIGPGSKVAGEIDFSILQGHVNKQHSGFLGHSYLSEWVNLGAGTVTSNLKVTYGQITATMPWGEEDTQRQFLGLLIGAHSKTAIGTRFSTGTVCGVCSNVMSNGFPDSAIPSFWWMPDESPYDLEKAIDLARIVMARRDTELGPATEKLLRYESGRET